jgi:hypothetical protein
MISTCWDAVPEKRPTALMLMEQLDAYIQNAATNTNTNHNGVEKTEEQLREEFVYI